MVNWMLANSGKNATIVLLKKIVCKIVCITEGLLVSIITPFKETD